MSFFSINNNMAQGQCGYMVNVMSTLAPPAKLALAYASGSIRPQFTLMLEIDNRLQQIVETAREPMIAQIKMAWWREAFEKSPHARPKGEPLLQALNEVGDSIPQAALESLVSAWEMLLGSDHWEHEVIAAHAALRSDAIFQTYARWVNARQDVQVAGKAWASDALQQAFPARFPKDVPSETVRFPKGRKLRTLSILIMSVRTSSGPRLVWHAVTGL